MTKVSGNMVQLKVTGSMSQLEVSGSIVQGSFDWAAYWAERYISALSILTTSDTEQTITATIIKTGFDGVSWEYSTDGVNYSVKGTSINGTYNATGLTAITRYYWRARLYKGANFGTYSSVIYDVTEATAIRHQTEGINDTVAFFAPDDLSTITKDGNNIISRFNDKLGSGHDLVTGAALWDSPNIISFDNISQYLKTGAFTYAQPEFIYLFLKQITWTKNNIIVSGFSNAHTGSIYQGTATPGLSAYCGGGGVVGPKSLPIGRWGIVRAKMNGATPGSSIQINAEAAGVGTLAVAAMGGITLGVLSGSSAFGHFQLKSAIFRKTLAGETDIYNYMKLKHKSDLTHFEYIHITDIFNSTVAELCTEPTALVSDDGEQIDVWFNLDYRMQYSYSTDGLTFAAPVATDVTLDYTRSHMLKVGDTYYLYATDWHATTPFHLFTSTDKINFTDQGAILNNGGGADWDEKFGNIFVWNEGANWYLLYEAANWGIDGGWHIGLATATAPEGPWTKYGSNPVLSETDQGCGNPELPRVNNQVIKSGGNYYMYYHRGKTGTNGAILRAYSADLITWTKEGIITDKRSTPYAPPGTNVDQCLVQFKGKSYMFYSPMNQVDEGYINIEMDDKPLLELLALYP